MQLVPYLIFDGDAFEAVSLYARVLGGQLGDVQRFGDGPMGASDAWKEKILHGHLLLDGQVIMFSDGREGEPVVRGQNLHLSINFPTETSIDAAFEALSEGAVVTMPLQDTFWGARFGMLTDRFGINWMFNYDRPQAS
jgi:PhnB protein